jgi:hypothetical protein
MDLMANIYLLGLMFYLKDIKKYGAFLDGILASACSTLLNDINLKSEPLFDCQKLLQ